MSVGERDAGVNTDEDQRLRQASQLAGLAVAGRVRRG